MTDQNEQGDLGGELAEDIAAAYPQRGKATEVTCSGGLMLPPVGASG